MTLPTFARPPDIDAAGQPGWPELFAALPLAVLLVDPDDRIARANSPAEQLLHRSERGMIGRPLAEMFGSPSELAIGQGQDLAVYDAEIATAAGTLRVDFTHTHLADHPGWRAVSLHATAARHLASPQHGARAAIGAAAMLAHEIKNPLSGIRGAAQLLGRNELTDLIVTEVDRVAALIDRMQDFTDTRPLQLAAENVYPILAHARRVAAAGFGAGIAIEERYDPSLPSALTNSDALTQILLNLLKNAAEATQKQPDPHILLTTAFRHGIATRKGQLRQELPIEICVVDNGPGAPADIADQLFEPFVSGRAGGVGLGLALVDKLVRDMGGMVRYAREHDRTVLRLLLPRGEG